MTTTIFFSVGEPSGDLHGANLIRALRQQDSSIRCVGYGGPRMEDAGCQLQADLTQLAVMWFLRAITNIHRFVGLLFRADRFFRSERPDAVVLIDYPGFNWWIARRAKARGIPVFYYGAPQIWAWAPWRVTKLRRLTDHVLCKLPFEESWFRQRACHAVYVGHPYFDELAERQLDEDFVRRQSNARQPLLVILPGSRGQEVSANLPELLTAARAARRQVPQLRVAISSFSQPQATLAQQVLDKVALDAEVHVGRTPELIESAVVCLACSGSVSLETLYHAKPTIILYRVGRFAYWLQERFRIARYITLVNLLATQRINRRPGEPTYDPDSPGAEALPMPEYLVCQDRSAAIARRVVRWLLDETDRQQTIEQLVSLRDRFGHPGASRRAAEYLVRELKGGKTDHHGSTLQSRSNVRWRRAPLTTSAGDAS